MMVNLYAYHLLKLFPYAVYPVGMTTSCMTINQICANMIVLQCTLKVYQSSKTELHICIL